VIHKKPIANIARAQNTIVFSLQNVAVHDTETSTDLRAIRVVDTVKLKLTSDAVGNAVGTVLGCTVGRALGGVVGNALGASVGGTVGRKVG
jgi:uncharacterized membrane protein